MTGLRNIALAGASLMVLAAPAAAQQAPAAQAPAPAAELNLGGGVIDEVVVTARRRDEDRQQVPLVVQAVTGGDLARLQVREFKDIQTIVPGLSMNQDTNGIGSRTTLRGVAFDVNASGNNGTVEFYFNEAPISAGALFQSMFDIGQIEVLRGPQGTLRGRASPSGSITVTSRRPVLGDYGAMVNATVNTWGESNLQAAVNVPLIKDKLAIRLAGVYDDSQDNRVHSINYADDPYRKTRGGRATLRFDPTTDLSLNIGYTRTTRAVKNFFQVESANLADPTLPASPILIRPEDREAVVRIPNQFKQDFAIWNWSGEYRLFGQKINYVGSRNEQKYSAFAPGDPGAAMPSTAPLQYLDAGQRTRTTAHQTNHEVRVSSDERVAGFIDYVAGAMWNKLESPSVIQQETPVFFGSSLRPVAFVLTPVNRGGVTRESSIFANVNFHIGDDTELSGGARRISYRSQGDLAISGVVSPAAQEDRTFHANIFSASLKHSFRRDLMAYFNFGSSWRAPTATNPILLNSQSRPTGVLAALQYPPAEKSKSYELGVKSEWLDGKLRVNADLFHQNFENFQFSAPNIFYLSDVGGVPGVASATAVAVGVPAKVDGVEAEIDYKPLPNLAFGAVMSYSKGTISNAVIPCNPYPGGVTPTPAQLLAATGGEQIATCRVSSLRAGTSAPFVATVQGEYTQPLAHDAEAYLRGFVNYNGKSLNDPRNPVDDVPSYALVNLFAGARAVDGGWDAGFYVKNLFDVERVLTRRSTPSTGGRIVGASVTTFTSAYREISMTPAREIGFNVRAAFGSR